MKRLLRIFLMAVLISALFLSLLACGGDKETAKDSDDVSADSSSTADNDLTHDDDQSSADDTNLSDDDSTSIPSADDDEEAPPAVVERMHRGVNLGNALEAPNEGEWGVTLEERDFQLIAAAGFDTVRIPIRWSAHADAEDPYGIDPLFFERIDWVLDELSAKNLIAVLNIHHYEELMEDVIGQRQRFLALWAQIAEHYRDYSSDLVFELCNEPTISSGDWNALAAEAITRIRESNPDRYIVVGGVMWNNILALDYLELPRTDRYLLATFHYYNPFDFTHQGAEWVDGSEAWLGATWEGTAEQKQAVTDDLELAASWAEKNRRKVFMGEFGAYSKADLDSRARWTSWVAREAERLNMPWSYWEFRSGFGVYDYNEQSWVEPLLEALIPASDELQ
jgi:endoglucanase